jgi:predicted AAA+ superfamily ATPase
MYKRNLYLTRILPFVDKPVIKVITGMRRVGKSYFLKQLIETLLKRQVSSTNILYIDKESLEFEAIASYRDLYETAKATLGSLTGRTYLFVDEIQEIDQWEKAISSLSQWPNLDIYITGSNAHMLSTELATLLSGRYIEFPIYVLSFDEYLLFRGAARGDTAEEFRNYIRFGGLPALHHFQQDEETVFQYINSIYNTILLKDIVKRNSIRNVALLENIGRYLFDNIGNIFSAKKICDYLHSQRLRVGVETVQNYIGHFTSALLAHKVPRYDLKGKRYLEIYEKYYLNDIGLRHALLGYREADISGVLENIVFLELKRLGYRVNIGKFGELEIDFVASRESEKIYIQVAYLLASPETIEREFRALKAIPDNYPKYVLSMDTVFGDDFDGIRRLYLVDFLLGKR